MSSASTARVGGVTAETSTAAYRLPLVVLGIAATDWVARSMSSSNLDHVAKPATIAALAIWFVVVQHDAGTDGTVAMWTGAAYRGGVRPRWFVAALVASLVGDILLIGPNTVAGGVAFLGAHICYVVGLDRHWLVRRRAWLLGLAVAVVVAVPVTLAVGGAQRLIGIGIPVYAIALVLMVASALSMCWQPDVRRAAATSVALGAVLFAVSDAILLIDFRRDTQQLGLAAIVVYHLGQLAIITGIVNLTAAPSTLRTAVHRWRPGGHPVTDQSPAALR